VPAPPQRFTALHTHIAWDMDDGGYTTRAEQNGPYGDSDWHCKSLWYRADVRRAKGRVLMRMFVESRVAVILIESGGLWFARLCL
jgi:hypothetical protein